MSFNAARGETVLSIDGADRKLCLTLGALAEIEQALGCATIAELDVRMRALSACDLVHVLRALLIGGRAPEIAGRLSEANVAPGEAASAVAEAFRLALAT